MSLTHRDATLRDLRLILTVQAIRAFLYGFGSILLGTSLSAGGLSGFEVSLVLTAMLAGMAVSSIAIGLTSNRLQRRRAYVALLATMGVAGTVFAVTRSVVLLCLAALTGTFSTDPNESGPITSLEQAMMGHAPPGLRTRVFGRYNAVAYLSGAIGALAAGGPAAVREVVGGGVPADQRWLLAFPLLAAACVLVARRLSDAVEVSATGPDEPHRRPLERSRPTVLRLAALFGMDSFAGGFVVQVFLVYWFHRRFGASPEAMGLVFFGTGLLQAASSIVAGRLAVRIGMLNTMVFTHLPSNVLLALVPAMPTLGAAVAVLLARFSLSQMDVPARQAYVVSMVDPQERTAAAAYTNTARYVTRPFGSLGAGTLIEHVALGAPFVVSGTLKVVYDLLLYGTFRRVPLPEDRDGG
ncbi:MAG: MFS transporter [Candidatus Velamenicoccus archaeovorus]